MYQPHGFYPHYQAGDGAQIGFYHWPDGEGNYRRRFEKMAATYDLGLEGCSQEGIQQLQHHALRLVAKLQGNQSSVTFRVNESSRSKLLEIEQLLPVANIFGSVRGLLQVAVIDPDAEGLGRYATYGSWNQLGLNGFADADQLRTIWDTGQIAVKVDTKILSSRSLTKRFHYVPELQNDGAGVRDGFQWEKASALIFPDMEFDGSTPTEITISWNMQGVSFDGLLKSTTESLYLVLTLDGFEGQSLAGYRF